jgi:polyphosphate glucokinase
MAQPVDALSAVRRHGPPAVHAVTSHAPPPTRLPSPAVAEERAFGIDIGGSGMKAAPVDLATGELVDDRFKILTPQPATPDAMADVVRQLVDHFGHRGRVGVTFPGVIRRGMALSAANLDPSWIGTDVDALFTAAAACDVHVVNDADAAGLAEVRYGAGRDRSGVVLVLTFGTGIGSGLFTDGVLVPNTELGHLELDGEDAEKRAAARARDREGLSWKDWAARVERYLRHVVRLFTPALIIVGGGASRKADKWLPYIDVDCEVVPAALTNEAGIVGAAIVGNLAQPLT